MGLGGAVEPLRERPFRLLWLGQLISAVGDALVPVALAFAVLDRLDGSAGDLGVVLAAFMGSRMVFIVVGGVWSDRLPRQFVMIGLCGGYTTFSSFSLQTLNLMRDGEWLRATGNAVVSLVLCMLAVWLGHVAAAGINQLKGA